MKFLVLLVSLYRPLATGIRFGLCVGHGNGEGRGKDKGGEADPFMQMQLLCIQNPDGKPRIGCIAGPLNQSRLTCG